jgi:hypothetical protein
MNTVKTILTWIGGVIYILAGLVLGVVLPAYGGLMCFGDSARHASSSFGYVVEYIARCGWFAYLPTLAFVIGAVLLFISLTISRKSRNFWSLPLMIVGLFAPWVIIAISLSS